MISRLLVHPVLMSLLIQGIFLESMLGMLPYASRIFPRNILQEYASNEHEYVLSISVDIRRVSARTFPVLYDLVLSFSLPVFDLL